MKQLSTKENDVLYRLKEKPALEPFFFKKARDLKWFDELKRRGYFTPTLALKPSTVVDSEQFINVPYWHAIDYLVNASKSLEITSNEHFSIELLKIIREVTAYARDEKFSNYKVWWQFSKIIPVLPIELFDENDINLFDFWFADSLGCELIGEELGEKWLPKLILTADQDRHELCLKLLSIIFRVHLASESDTTNSSRKVSLTVDSYRAKRIGEKISGLLGEKKKANGVKLLQASLEVILTTLDNDKWSSIWRPSIANNAQNHSIWDTEDIVLETYRDALVSFVKADPIASRAYVECVTSSPFITIARIGLYALNMCFVELKDSIGNILKPRFFSSNFRHEVWHLLHQHYREFDSDLKKKILLNIDSSARSDEQDSEDIVAYQKAIWLSAIKDVDGDARQIYDACIQVTGYEPENPDFSSYVRTGWVSENSPLSAEAMASMDGDELIQAIKNFEDTPLEFNSSFSRTTKHGLAQALGQAIKIEPIKFSSKLQLFSRLDASFCSRIVESYNELWRDKAPLPWDELWSRLLLFSRVKIFDLELDISTQEAKSLYSSIARLIENGSRSDEHAFNEKFMPIAEEIILKQIETAEGAVYDATSDALTHAINSSKGNAIEALIMLALRAARIETNATDSREISWAKFEPIFSKELNKSGVGSYEFATLLGNYLPNFMYLSSEWVTANFEKIFDTSDYVKWSCALKGYSYVQRVDRKIYKLLKEFNHFIPALNDTVLSEHVHHKLIQNIALAYIYKDEELSDESSLICELVQRGKFSELSQLIWFLSTIPSEECETVERVIGLWKFIVKTINQEFTESKKILASLSKLARLIKKIDQSTGPLLNALAKNSAKEHDSYHLLEALAKLSKEQPQECFEIWSVILEKTAPYFPEESVRTILENLVASGSDGRRSAVSIANAYLNYGNDFPHKVVKSL